MAKKKKEMTKEELHEWFMDYVGETYDTLNSMFRFSNIKRLTMDRSSYLNVAERFFEEFYEIKLKGVPFDEEIIDDLIEGFDKDTEIVEWIKS